MTDSSKRIIRLKPGSSERSDESANQLVRRARPWRPPDGRYRSFAQPVVDFGDNHARLLAAKPFSEQPCETHHRLKACITVRHGLNDLDGRNSRLRLGARTPCLWRRPASSSTASARQRPLECAHRALVAVDGLLLRPRRRRARFASRGTFSPTGGSHGSACAKKAGRPTLPCHP
jgi:hypothetical protein